MADNTKALTLEDCYNWVFENIFPLRPADYCSKYPKWPGLVGIEIEMLPIRAASLGQDKAETVPLYGPASISEMLFSLKTQHPDWKYVSLPEGSDHLMSVQLEEGDQLSFEPGGQFEFSSKPYPCLGDALHRLEAMQDLLMDAARQRSIEILQLGMNPWRTVQEIGLQMDKPRYQAMNAFFAAQGPHGQRMMRQTCTIQLNLDFGGNEEILAKRYLLANLIAPMATSVFAHSPLVDNKATGLLSNRASTWQHMDETRTGFTKLDEVESSLSRRACVDAYLDWLLKGRLIFIESLGYEVMDGHFTFGDWIQRGYKGVFPKLKDLQTHLSLLFPEVRARGFLELRSVDCQHRAWQAAPAAYYTGLLYDDKSLNDCLELLLPHRHRLYEFWRQSAYGLRHDDLASLAKKVMEHALAGFARLPTCYHGNRSLGVLERFYDRYTAQRKTPADELLALHSSKGALRAADLQRLDELWLKQNN